jgi:DnaJ domain
MDPFQTLGIARHCSKEEAKKAFRARARKAHPDRGGDVGTFIALRDAYEQVLRELERRAPSTALPPSKRAAQPARPPQPPDPDWKPELVVSDEPMPRTEPPQPPDPDWDPDLILLDDEPEPQWNAGADAAIRHERYVAWLHHALSDFRNRERAAGLGWWYAAGLAVAAVALLAFLTGLLWPATKGGTAARPPTATHGAPARD